MSQSFHVLYFGLLAERRGCAQETVESAAQTAAELYAELDRIHLLGLDPENFRVALNDGFVEWSQPLKSGDTIALLPPMSGG